MIEAPGPLMNMALEEELFLGRSWERTPAPRGARVEESSPHTYSRSIRAHERPFHGQNVRPNVLQQGPVVGFYFSPRASLLVNQPHGSLWSIRASWALGSFILEVGASMTRSLQPRAQTARRCGTSPIYFRRGRRRVGPGPWPSLTIPGTK